MTPIKKIFLISGIVLCFVVVLISGIVIYLYYHPDRVKPMIERSLSGFTGAPCTIKSLSYSFQPMVVEAEGILFNPLKSENSFSMEIRSVKANMTVEGPWGHRSLVLKNVQVNGLYLDLFPERFVFPGGLPEKKEHSFFAGMIRRFIGFFFFRDVKFQSGELLDGNMSAVLADQAVQAHRVHAGIGTDKLLFVSFALAVKDHSRKLNFTAPNVTISGGQTFDINDLKFTGTLQSRGMQLKSPEFSILKMAVLSKFTFGLVPKVLDIESLNVGCKGIVVGSDLEKMGTLSMFVTGAESLSVETGLTYQMNQGKIILSLLKFRIEGLSLTKKSNKLPPVLDFSMEAEEISGNYPVIQIREAAALIPQVKINTGIRDMIIGDIRVHIPDGRLNAEKKSIILPDVRLDAVGLKNLLLGIRLEERHLDFEARGNHTELFQAAATYRLIPSDWTIDVHDAIQISLKGPRTGPWQVKAKLSLDDLAFQNKDGSIMGEKVSLVTGIEGVMDLGPSRMRFDADIDARAGEFLYDRYYLNLKRNPIVSSCEGFYDIQKRILELSRLRFDLTDILPLEIKGFFKQSPKKANADFSVIIPKIPLKPLFQHFLQEPYQTESPFLTTLETEGTVSAEFRINGFQDAWEISGCLGWLGGKFSLPEKGIAFKGISADIPLWFQSGLPKDSAETLKGQVKVQSMTVPFLPDQPLIFPLDTGPNRISIASPTVIQVPGGDFRLGPVKIERLFGPDLVLRTDAAFDGIKLQPFLSKIWKRPLAGNLSGTLNPIRYEHHAVTAHGELNADVFEGRIILSDLGASGIFTPAPVYKLNVKWEDLSLSEMTTDTEFGTIEGILAGHLRDFEMAYGQPQRFNLLLETVQEKGVSQRISVKAVENIAQIGGGQSPFMGMAGAFASLFKTFPYEKIGIRAHLENDVFTVNGTIREAGTEYLVKRGGFSGVNIINQNPDNRISFRDMVKRIKRISSKGGGRKIKEGGSHETVSKILVDGDGIRFNHPVRLRDHQYLFPGGES